MDSSAFLAFLWQESGHEKLISLLDDAVISAVNLAEIYSKCADRGIDTDAVKKMISALAIKIAPFDETCAFVTGDLRARTRVLGLSLGDRACLATAISETCQVITADRVWVELAPSLGLDIVCIR